MSDLEVTNRQVELNLVLLTSCRMLSSSYVSYESFTFQFQLMRVFSESGYLGRVSLRHL
uniref:Uncharacterized protein n=1 Tax=Rhizophora mucronata TaxID=61149 RepID=A0A2P2NCE7_RHIMU